jgi:hypothetical protein
VPWIEVFDHLFHIYQDRAVEMQWQTAVASYAHTDKRGRQAIGDSIKQYGEFDPRPGRTPKSAGKRRIYDSWSHEERLLAVGSCLTHQGEKWLERRPYQREWLDRQGLSPEDAISRYDEWSSRELTHEQPIVVSERGAIVAGDR